MAAIEFTTELTDAPTLAVPAEVSAGLPKSGQVRVLVLTEDEDEAAADAAWWSFAYDQFVRDDPPEDAVYDTLR